MRPVYFDTKTRIFIFSFQSMHCKPCYIIEIELMWCECEDLTLRCSKSVIIKTRTSVQKALTHFLIAGKPFNCWKCYHTGRIKINSVYNLSVLVARMFATNPACLSCQLFSDWRNNHMKHPSPSPSSPNSHAFHLFTILYTLWILYLFFY